MISMSYMTTAFQENFSFFVFFSSEVTQQHSCRGIHVLDNICARWSYVRLTTFNNAVRVSRTVRKHPENCDPTISPHAAGKKKKKKLLGITPSASTPRPKKSSGEFDQAGAKEGEGLRLMTLDLKIVPCQGIDLCQAL